MTRINAIRNIAGTRDFVAWGKENSKESSTSSTNYICTNIRGNINALVFAAVLVVCSVAVGCSSDKPKPISSNNQIPVPQAPSPVAPTPAPVLQAENKPAPKKIVRRKPATVNYTDKTFGVAFEYPRRYAIETGDAAAELLTSSPVPMNFVAPGGVALAAVELPETGYANTDFSSAFFNVSVHKTLTADQCTEFAVPQPKVAASVSSEPVAAAPASTETSSTQTASAQTTSTQAGSTQSQAVTPVAADAQSATAASTTPSAQSDSTNTTVASSAKATDEKSGDVKTGDEKSTDQKPNNDKQADAKPAPVAQSQPAMEDSKQDSKPSSKLLLGDLELHGTEAVSGEGTRQSDSKYFHVFQNGSCYEFALNVTTVASEDGMTKHIDRDKVFSRLEQILSTVKISPLTPEVTAETPKTPVAPTAPETPAQ
jgi:hypothetical protein